MRWSAFAIIVVGSSARAQAPDDASGISPPRCEVTLVDAATTAPLAGVDVHVGRLEGTTDTTGRFIAGASGPQTVSAFARGYRALDAAIACDGGVTLGMEADGPRDRELGFQYPTNYQRRTGWQGELGFVIGDARIDGASASTTPGVALAGGGRFDRFTFLGEYTLAGIHYGGPFAPALAHGGVPQSDTDGLVHHAGITTRYAFARAGAQPIVAFWLEGGAGMQVARWERGGTFARPDVSLGLGMHVAVPTSAGVRRGGAFLALRFYLGRRTDVDSAPAMCTAPCTMSSPPAAWSDSSLVLHAGYTFGN